jgi:chemotaxis protein MotA
VGTFLGVFLSYGLVGPFATKLKALMQQEAHFYQLIRQVLITNLHNHSTTICIEVGRQNTPQIYRPSFAVLEHALKELKVSLA